MGEKSTAQCFSLRYDGVMPVSPAVKVEALARDFGSKRRLASVLGVDPAQVTRWSRGGRLDPENAARLDLLELVLSHLARVYDPAVHEDWLHGLNPHLGDRRPIDAIRAGQATDLLEALRAEEAGSFA
jgi:uncharacterized protein (DUF2384 family)